MSYAYCEIHNEDATNGCLSCNRDRIAQMSDRQIISELLGIAIIAEPVQAGLMEARVNQILYKYFPEPKVRP